MLAPGVFCAESVNALWKYRQAGTPSRDEAIRRHEEARGLVDAVIPDRDLSVEALVVADERRHPVCEAVYVVAARRHGARLITCDRRFARLAKAVGVAV